MVAHAQLYYHFVLRAVSVARDCSVFVVLFIYITHTIGMTSHTLRSGTSRKHSINFRFDMFY